MREYPLNLALRFLLELVLLFVFAYWGWHRFSGSAKYLVAIGSPLLAAVVWAIFKVDGDPDKAIVSIPGWLRLLYEMVLFTVATLFLFQLQLASWAIIFIIVSVLHYAFSYQRILWLLKQ